MSPVIIKNLTLYSHKVSLIQNGFRLNNSYIIMIILLIDFINNESLFIKQLTYEQKMVKLCFSDKLTANNNFMGI